MRRHLTAETVYGFTSAFLLERFDNPQPTPTFHEDLWAYACSDSQWVAMGAPRGFAKSTAITHAYALANICFRHRDHVLIVSDTEAQAIGFLNDLKLELTENEALMESFNIKGLIKDTEAEFIGEFEDGTQFRVLAKGSEQKIRGMKWRNKRPNLIIGDDLENDEIVLNEERRAKFRRWFYNALLPSGSDDCIVRVVGTILHFDSLLARLIPLEESEGAVVDGCHITWTPEEQAKREWLSCTFRAHPGLNDFEELLWEEKFPKKRLLALRNAFVQDGNAEGYAQEYLNSPLDPENAYFKPEHILPTPDEDKPPREEFYASIDMAISEKKKRAYMAIPVIGVTPDGRIRTRHVERFRGDSLDIIEAMARIQRTWNIEFWVVEEENIARSLGPILEDKMRRREIPYMVLHTMVPNVDKMRRARPLQARMRAGTWTHDATQDWFPALQQEFLQFPKGKYSDQVDALAWLGLMLDSIHDARSHSDIEDEEYENAYEADTEEEWGDESSYSNRYTGY